MAHTHNVCIKTSSGTELGPGAGSHVAGAYVPDRWHSLDSTITTIYTTEDWSADVTGARADLGRIGPSCARAFATFPRPDVDISVDVELHRRRL